LAELREQYGDDDAVYEWAKEQIAAAPAALDYEASLWIDRLHRFCRWFEIENGLDPDADVRAARKEEATFRVRCNDDAFPLLRRRRR
jgi:hypothetical protein